MYYPLSNTFFFQAYEIGQVITCFGREVIRVSKSGNVPNEVLLAFDYCVKYIQYILDVGY